MNAFLKINSRTNPDICGSWAASDIESEMIDIEMPIKRDTDWIDYVISRIFMDEDYEFPQSIIDCIALFKDSMFKAEFKLGNDWIKLEYSIC